MAPIAKTFKAVGSKILKSRTINIGFVETTDKWKRVKLNSEVQREFNKAVENNSGMIKPDAVGVYMQYVYLSTRPSR